MSANVAVGRLSLSLGSLGGSERLVKTRRILLFGVAAIVGLLVCAWVVLKMTSDAKKAEGVRQADQPARNDSTSEFTVETAAVLGRLQGYWEGVGLNGGVKSGRASSVSESNVSITITGNSLHFYARTDYWYGTTFTLPSGTDPQQLYATIKEGVDFQTDPKASTGSVVAAIFKIEDGALTFAVAPSPYKPPKTFPSAGSHYVLKRRTEPKKLIEPKTP